MSGVVCVVCPFADDEKLKNIHVDLALLVWGPALFSTHVDISSFALSCAADSAVAQDAFTSSNTTPSCLLARSDGATPLPFPCQATTACLASKRAAMIMTGTVCILEMSLASWLRVHKALRYKSSASEDLDEAFWDQDKGEITIFFKKGQRLKKSLTC